MAVNKDTIQAAHTINGCKPINAIEMEHSLKRQEAIDNLADKYMDEADKQGYSFSEGLCNWAVNKAVRELGDIR